MDHFAGLDVSVKETSVCIVDDTGKIVREVKVASEPNAFGHSALHTRSRPAGSRSTRGWARVPVTPTVATKKAASVVSFLSRVCWRATRRGRTSRST
jgi:hypothetical protein